MRVENKKVKKFTMPPRSNVTIVNNKSVTPLCYIVNLF